RAYSLYRHLHSRELHAFPTRRSSDLGMPMENAASELFYSKIGSASLMFNPWKYGFAVMAAPTEDDQTFRKQTLQGYVHDQTAARSEEHTSESSHVKISYAVFCLKKKT